MGTSTGNFDIELALLLDAIYLKYHYDFRAYSKASLKRRLQAASARFACDTISQLQDRILREPETFTALLGYLTVQVSQMFRDPSFYRSVADNVVPLMRTYPSLKVWVAGCSTGEEVYSIAIMLAEAGLLKRTLIYATDINPRALQTAEAGIYDLDRIAGFTADYIQAGGRSSLSDYYTAAYGKALFNRSLREHVVFSDHSLTTDSVFSEVQLISCRNVLIYFTRELQDRALALFVEALCHRGFLGLGGRESLRFSSSAGAFEELDRLNRLYRKRAHA